MYESSCSYQGALELKRTTATTCPLGIKTEEFSTTADWPAYRFCNPSTFEQLKQSVEKAKAALQDRTSFFGNTSAFSDLYNVSSGGRNHQDNIQDTTRLRDSNDVDIKRVVGACIIGTLYINDIFSKISSYRGYESKKIINYGYDSHNGPSQWKNYFAEAAGHKQSPINLVTHCAIIIPSELQPLKFSEEFSHIPSEMKLYNSGLNAVLYAKWNGLNRPSLTGGPFNSVVYNFLNIRFRWGPTDDEGSEHMIDTKRFAIEMQVAFMKNGNNPRCDILEAARCGNLLMLSYFFMVTPVDNPYLEPIIQSLKILKYPLSCAMICPFPLKLLMPMFSKNYFSYDGSLTFPPCTEGVKWIVQSEPLCISSRQVSKFRKLAACNCVPIISNARPVQKHNGRQVIYYD